MKTNSQHNRMILYFVASKLYDLLENMVFVGGCAAGFLITDKVAPDVRATIDVDIIVNVILLLEFNQLEQKLSTLGFKQPHGEHPICRWQIDHVLVDIIPINQNILGFSNSWYPQAMQAAQKLQLDPNICIRLITAPYFLATKIESFQDRGNSDFLASHDFEDIIALIDGRSELLLELNNSESDLKLFLVTTFKQWLSNNELIESLPGHLSYAGNIQDRITMLLDRMNNIAQLDKVMEMP